LIRKNVKRNKSIIQGNTEIHHEGTALARHAGSIWTFFVRPADGNRGHQ
jgi:hypothetical protein